jgi:hypothetical protein
MGARLIFFGRLVLPALFIFFIVGCLAKPPSEVSNVTVQTPAVANVTVSNVTAQASSGVSNGNFRYHCAISENVTCTGSFSKDGAIMLNVVDSNGPQRSVRIRGPIDTIYMCRLNGTEHEEVTKLTDILTDKSTGKLTDINQIRNYCIERSTYHNACGVESNPASNPVVLGCDNTSIVSEDNLNYVTEGTKYHIYVLVFAYGERMDAYNSYGELNKTAYQKFLSDKSCSQDGQYFYDCAVEGAFVAIPQ